MTVSSTTRTAAWSEFITRLSLLMMVLGCQTIEDGNHGPARYAQHAAVVFCDACYAGEGFEEARMWFGRCSGGDVSRTPDHLLLKCDCAVACINGAQSCGGQKCTSWLTYCGVAEDIINSHSNPMSFCGVAKR
jgi:hypothetical protein